MKEDPKNDKTRRDVATILYQLDLTRDPHRFQYEGECRGEV
jgi:hypothetical protein